MAIDLTIYLDDQPGELARLGEVLGRGGVNIDGFCAVTSGGGRAEVHVLVEDATAAFTELTAAGIGIGETREERIDALLALRALNDRYGHIQEVIIQNFRPKAGTRMARAPEASLEEHLWTIAAARLVFAADDLARAQAALVD